VTRQNTVNDDISLPLLIMTPGDVSRLRRELAILNEYLQQQAVRAPGQPMAKLPKTSRLLDELAAANKLNLLDPGVRINLAAFLADIATHSPVVHVSFAVDPSATFLVKIVAWFRQNIHPATLVRVGLQPTIAAGCAVRTTNKYFDCSLGQHLRKQRGVLLDMLVAKAGSETPTPAAQAVPAEAAA
jgi:hypothetical protein